MPVLVNILTKQQVLDLGGRRKIHKGFVPSMGGIAIFLGFFFAVSVWLPLHELAFYRYFCVATAVVFVTGVRDDLEPLSPRGKLIMQLFAALLVVWGGGGDSGIRITSFCGLLGINELPLVVSYLLSIFVIIVVTNAFNLIDGLDGLAGLIGLITLTLMTGWFLLTSSEQAYHNWGMAMLMIGFIGGTVAFLCYNWHPATIFMGDTGSLLLGFVLSVGVIKFLQINGDMTFVSQYKAAAPISLAVAIVIIPLFDAGRVFLLRISQGRSPFSPDKQHIHHMLLRMGLKHSQATLILGSLYVALIGFFFLLSRKLSDNFLLPIITLTCVVLHFLLRYIIELVFQRRRDGMQDEILSVLQRNN